MTNIKTLTISTAQGRAKELLEGAKKAVGKELNIFGVMANSPAALEGLLNFNSALSKGKLDAKLREQLALTTAGQNKCGYCASAHSYMAEHAGVPANECSINLKGKSSDKKIQAALTFATQVTQKRGSVTDADLKAVHDAGYSDEEVIEILALVALNTFTNYFNKAFKTEIDFPVVDLESVLV